jgi:hypothetical protein
MISLYDLQDESQVFDDMEMMPGFNKKEQKDLRKSKYLSLWQRNTLSWKIECESMPGKDRATAYNTFRQYLRSPSRLTTAQVFAWILFAVECALLIPICINQDSSIGAGMCSGVTGAVLFAIIAFCTNNSKSILGDNKQIVASFGIANDCADQYTVVPTA